MSQGKKQKKGESEQLRAHDRNSINLVQPLLCTKKCEREEKIKGVSRGNSIRRNCCVVGGVKDRRAANRDSTRGERQGGKEIQARGKLFGTNSSRREKKCDDRYVGDNCKLSVPPRSFLVIAALMNNESVEDPQHIDLEQ